MSKIKDRIERHLPDWAFAIREHWRRHGALPNLIAPQTLNEKILYRKLFDRRPLLAQIADKVAARSYVEDRLGSQILPRLYFVTNSPKAIPFDDLPEKFVLKPNHGSGWVQIVTDNSSLDREATIKLCNDWLTSSFYQTTREWHYKQIEPRILVEEFIDDGTGTVPIDYKLFVFSGVVEFIQIDTGRFTDHRRRLYTPHWQKIDVLYGHGDIEGDLPQPAHFAEMIEAAEILAKNLDFIRVDFYDTPARPYFGELTNTPGCGWERFEPKQFDRHFGALWSLPARRLLRA